jgi:lysozyme family protein
VASFDNNIATVLKSEGGFTKDPKDQGNYYNGVLIGTNRGITPGAYYAAYKRVPSTAEIAALTPAQAKGIYKKNYWDKIAGDQLANDSVALLMLDTIVNSGASQLSMFRKAANGIAGKKIMQESASAITGTEAGLINALPQDKYFALLKATREAFYKKLVQKKPSNAKFLQGWLNRLNKHVYSGASSGGSSTGGKGGKIALAVAGLIGIGWLARRYL